MRHAFAALLVIVTAASALAQQPQPARAVGGPASALEPAQQAPPPPPPPPGPPAPPANVDPINVRYEIAVRDTGGPQPGTKTVTMVTTAGEVSSVRATGTKPGGPLNPLNIDVWPMTIADGRVRTRISFEYVPQSPTGPPPLTIRQTIHVWLTSGAAMVVSQATDPLSERRIEVSATATVLK
jgi:hypothetical protein